MNQTDHKKLNFLSAETYCSEGEQACEFPFNIAQSQQFCGNQALSVLMYG